MKVPWNKRSVRAGLGCLVVLALGLLAGCASGGDTENLSERPWNAPKSWEGGLPSSMLEGR